MVGMGVGGRVLFIELRSIGLIFVGEVFGLDEFIVVLSGLGVGRFGDFGGGASSLVVIFNGDGGGFDVALGL